MECFVLGQPNSGKTSLVLSLACFLGLRVVEMEVVGAEGPSRRMSMELDRAWSSLVSPRPYTTMRLQRFTLSIPGRRITPITLVDTPGLVEGIVPDQGVRASVSHMLLHLQKARAIIHVLDARTLKGRCVSNSEGISWWPEIDRELFEFNRIFPYLLVVSKTDLNGTGQIWERVDKCVRPDGVRAMAFSLRNRMALGSLRAFLSELR